MSSAWQYSGFRIECGMTDRIIIQFTSGGWRCRKGCLKIPEMVGLNQRWCSWRSRRMSRRQQWLNRRKWAFLRGGWILFVKRYSETMLEIPRPATQASLGFPGGTPLFQRGIERNGNWKTHPLPLVLKGNTTGFPRSWEWQNNHNALLSLLSEEG